MPHLISRTALVAAAATVLTACASTAQYPIVEGGTPGTGPQMASPSYPVQRPAENMPAPQPRPTEAVESGVLSPAAPAGTVESAQLAPPVTAEDSGAASAYVRPAPEPEPEPEPAYTPPPQPITKVVTLAPGKVIDVDGRPATYTVKEGQGLDAVARAMGSSRKELATLNNLKEPYALKPGQVLKGPASRAKAYVVAPADTLSQISRRFGVSVQALAEENEIDTATPLRVGQKIKLPAGYKDAGPIKKTITVTPDPVVAPPPRPRPEPVRPRPEPTPEPTPEPFRPLPRPEPVRPQPQPEPVRPRPEPVRPRSEPTRPTPGPKPSVTTPAPAPTPSRPIPTTPAPAPGPSRPAAPLLPTDRAPTLGDFVLIERLCSCCPSVWG